MSSNERIKRLALFSLPLIAVALGLLLAVNGSLLGVLAILLGGAILILVGSGQADRLQLSALRKDRSHTPEEAAASGQGITTGGVVAASQATAAQQSSTEVTEEGRPAAHLASPSAMNTDVRRLNWLALALMFVLGLVLGLILDGVLPLPRWEAQPSVTSASSVSPAISPIPLLEGLMHNDAGLVNETLQAKGEALEVLHSQLDMGQAADIFDENFDTLMRGSGANPFIIEVRYPQPHTANMILLSLASMYNYEITVIVTTDDDKTIPLRNEGIERTVDPTLEFALPGGEKRIKSVYVEILDRRPPPQEGFHTHVRDFWLK